jgi:hypothetical protein
MDVPITCGGATDGVMDVIRTVAKAGIARAAKRHRQSFINTLLGLD